MTNLIKAHFPDCSFENPRVEEDTAQPRSGLLDFLNISRVRESFDSFGSYKAAGPDEIQPVLYHNLPQVGYELILFMFQQSIKLHHIPHVWRKMNVIFIPKTGKEDYGNAKSFRRITLSNFILKGLERIIQWYLTGNIIALPLPSQHAYTEGRSCETALCDAVHYMERNITKKYFNVCVSLDCSGAFDNISFDKAKAALQHHGVDSALSNWLLQLLKGREIRYTDKNLDLSRTFYPTRGTPQGGVVSPLLWNIIIDELICKIKSRTCLKVVCYADDILLLHAGKEIDPLAFEIQRGLNIIRDWAQDSGLTFNPTKTQACIVTNKRITAKPVLKLNGQQLQITNTFKYLGLTIDKTLTWRQHVMNKMTKVRKLSHLAKNVIGNKWGLTPDKIIWILTSIIRPITSYGGLVWSHRLKNTTLQQKLQSIQRPLLLAATGAMRSTPQATLEVILGIPPLHLHIQELSLQAKARYFLTHGISWEGGTTLSRGNSVKSSLNILRSIPHWGKNSDLIPKTRIFSDVNPRIHSDLSYHIYCDGSKMDDATGMAACITQEEFILHHIGHKLPSYATVFQAEVLAIKEALSWVKDAKIVAANIIIWSDSQAALAAISNTIVTSRLVRETKHLLSVVSRDNSINLHWVRGHDNNTGNELADTYAKAAALQGQLHYIPPPLIALKGSIKAFYRNKWEQMWNSLTGLEHSKKMITKVPHNILFKTGSWFRQDLKLLAEVTSGHCLLNNHLIKWREEILLPLCRLCEEELETPHHLYADCAALTRYRFQFYQSHSQGNDNTHTILETYRDYFKECHQFHDLQRANSELIRG